MIDLNDVVVAVGLVLAFGGAWLMAEWAGVALVVGACTVFVGVVRQMPRKG